MKEHTGCVYGIRFKADGKYVYVGVTKRTVRRRWYEHRTKTKSVLAQAISLFGADAFEPAVLETVPISTLSEREQHWIVELGTLWPEGLNRTRGGDGNCCNGRPGWRVEKYKSAWQNDPDRRKRTSEQAKALWADTEKRKILVAKMTERARARCADPEERRKRSERTKKLWTDPEYRKRAEARSADPAYRKNLSEKNKATKAKSKATVWS